MAMTVHFREEYIFKSRSWNLTSFWDLVMIWTIWKLTHERKSCFGFPIILCILPTKNVVVKGKCPKTLSTNSRGQEKTFEKKMYFSKKSQNLHLDCWHLLLGLGIFLMTRTVGEYPEEKCKNLLLHIKVRNLRRLLYLG